MRTGFLKLADEFSDRCVVIDGARDMDRVAKEILETVQGRLS